MLHDPHRNAPVIAALVALALVVTPNAVADETVTRGRTASAGVLMTPRDPLEFADELVVALPRPTLLLSLEDAVASQILQLSRSLSEQDALRVASVLCEEAARVGVDALLLLAVMYVESFYDHLAVSPAGAEGLMQLMPPTARWTAAQSDLAWHDEHSFDPVMNVRVGARYLGHLQRELGRLDWALTAYNRGPGATWFLIREHRALPQPVVDFYATKVLERFQLLRAQFGARSCS